MGHKTSTITLKTTNKTKQTQQQHWVNMSTRSNIAYKEKETKDPEQETEVKPPMTHDSPNKRKSADQMANPNQN